MCGRYAASRGAAELVEEFGVQVPPERTLPPDFNVAPTKDVYAVVERAGPGEDSPRRRLVVVRWGLVPPWAKDPSVGSRMVNARVETVAEKPAFRRAYASRRCLVPADGYYEWYDPGRGAGAGPGGGRGRKQPYFLRPADGGVLAMAGLYELWRDRSEPDAPWLWTVTVLTTRAADDLHRIHDRMPLLVERADWDRWLDPAAGADEELAHLLVPAAPGRLAAVPVSTAVNSVRNNGPGLLEPVPSADIPDGAPGGGAGGGQAGLFEDGA